MSALSDRQQWLESYVQLDQSSRGGRFSEFVQAVKAVAADEGKAAAAAWCRRAVSPLLDFSSLLTLRRLMGATAAEGGVRLAILGGPTTTQLRQLMEVFLAGEGIACSIYEADYGLIRQEILSPGSGLDAFQPQIVFFAIGARDVQRSPQASMDAEQVAQLADEEYADWQRLWRTANEKWNATVILNNLEIQPGSVFGHYAVRHPAARENFLDRLNKLFAHNAPPYVVLHDQFGLANELGARSWFDARFYHEFKMPCGAECLVPYAYSVVSLVRAVLGRSKKVLVLDLDNTVWGGVVGDLGAGGIRVGQGSGEGEAFLAFQRYALELKERGVLLAVCSKNDDDKAREPFERRSDMILKLSDISCFVANWNNKADNIAAIAEQLELKADSFVFVDDNPAERALVRRFAPAVAVPDMPEDPAGYVQALAQYRYFETVGFTPEDASRARFYSDNARRKEMAASATDIDSFLASLKMRMKAEPIGDLNIERATQLVNKSNQFNLTTRRYTLAQVRDLAASENWRTLTLSLADSLGDNGLIAVLLFKKHGRDLVVDTWVMSCRVLQRGVEAFTRNEIVEIARRAGCEHILGAYAPTAKNDMVKDHYAKMGFAAAGSDGEQTHWSLEVDAAAPLTHFIEREANDD